MKKSLAVERVPFKKLRELFDVLHFIEASSPPTVEGALAVFEGLPPEAFYFGPHGFPVTPQKILWAAKWLEKGVTLDQVRKRLYRGY
jgi:hypothetical protein